MRRLLWFAIDLAVAAALCGAIWMALPGRI